MTPEANKAIALTTGRGFQFNSLLGGLQGVDECQTNHRIDRSPARPLHTRL